MTPAVDLPARPDLLALLDLPGLATKTALPESWLQPSGGAHHRVPSEHFIRMLTIWCHWAIRSLHGSFGIGLGGGVYSRVRLVDRGLPADCQGAQTAQHPGGTPRGRTNRQHGTGTRSPPRTATASPAQATRSQASQATPPSAGNAQRLTAGPSEKLKPDAGPHHPVFRK